MYPCQTADAKFGKSVIIKAGNFLGVCSSRDCQLVKRVRSSVRFGAPFISSRTACLCHLFTSEETHGAEHQSLLADCNEGVLLVSSNGNHLPLRTNTQRHGHRAAWTQPEILFC